MDVARQKIRPVTPKCVLVSRPPADCCARQGRRLAREILVAVPGIEHVQGFVTRASIRDVSGVSVKVCASRLAVRLPTRIFHFVIAFMRFQQRITFTVKIKTDIVKEGCCVL